MIDTVGTQEFGLVRFSHLTTLERKLIKKISEIYKMLDALLIIGKTRPNSISIEKWDSEDWLRNLEMKHNLIKETVKKAKSSNIFIRTEDLDQLLYLVDEYNELQQSFDLDFDSKDD